MLAFSSWMLMCLVLLSVHSPSLGGGISYVGTQSRRWHSRLLNHFSTLVFLLYETRILLCVHVFSLHIYTCGTCAWCLPLPLPPSPEI